MTTARVSVLIPTFNNAEQIRAVLNDVSWADQVLIVDSFSTDSTLEICREYTEDIIQHEYINSAKQKNWAIPQCRYEWVFLVDTDERLPDTLQGEIRSLLASGMSDSKDAYRVARKTIFLDKWIRTMNLWPDYQVRLFRRDVACYEDKEVHADVIVPGAIGTLKHALVHNATPKLSKQIATLDRYSRYKSDELWKAGRRFRRMDLVVRPVGVLLYLYLLKGGWREGVRGLIIAFHQMAFTFFTYARLWEKEWRAAKQR